VSISELAPISSPTLQGKLVLGRYRVVRPLARGGMGIVYLGRVEGAAGFAKPVVIKSVIGSLGTARESEQLFAREARIVANLQHPAIVAVIDFGAAENSYVMVLEYVHGFHLGQWLRFVTETRGSMPVHQAAYVVLCILDALDFAHGVMRADGTSLGIVHRDVSPANVLIDVRGHVKLSDFGIARSEDDEFKTQEGLFRGTLPYSAPETLQGRKASPAVDQYAAAVLLYQLLSGRNPFKGAEPPETVARVLTLVPPSVCTLRPDVPAGVGNAIRKALSKDPADRFGSASEFARALRAACAWSEREAADAFTAQIEADFNGSMAEKLGLEPLSLRETSWRDAQEVTPGKSVTLSSTPPRIVSTSGSQPVAIAQGAHQVDVSEVATARVGRAELRAAAPPPSSEQSAGSAATPAPQRKPWLWIVLAALAAGAGSAAVLVFAGAREAPRTAGVVVIEKQPSSVSETEEAPAPPAPAASPSAESLVAAPPAPVEAPVRAVKSAGQASSESTGGAPLAQAFQRQSGKIQRCFGENPGAVQGISVRFQIDTAGKVQNAVVTPPSVAGTPLGACIASVARTTNFGPQSEPVAFSIPIAARVVKR
jgi:eukaryotic-like serine/threonine-protein kinase